MTAASDVHDVRAQNDPQQLTRSTRSLQLVTGRVSSYGSTVLPLRTGRGKTEELAAERAAPAAPPGPAPGPGRVHGAAARQPAGRHPPTGSKPREQGANPQTLAHPHGAVHRGMRGYHVGTHRKRDIHQALLSNHTHRHGYLRE